MADAIGQLMDEHRLIEKVLGSLATFADGLGGGGDTDRERMAEFAEFFREFADHCHHGKEEDRLFQTMAKHGFPTDTGPVAVMLYEHEVGRAHVRRLTEIGSGSGPLTEAETESVRDHVRQFVPLLAGHIQKEDGILYPMALQALPAEEIAALERDFDEFERTEMGEGTHTRLYEIAERLIGTYPPNETALTATGGCGSVIR